jgi:hypothetical protein
MYGLCALALPYSRFYFNEPLTTLGFLIAAYGLIAYRMGGTDGTTDRLPWLAVGGAGFGLAVLTRTTSALLLPLFLAYVCFANKEGEPDGIARSRLESSAVFALPVVILSLVQAGYQLWAFGDPLSGGYGGEGWRTPLSQGLYGLLLSPGKSLPLFVPLTVLAPWGWVRWAVEGRRREALLFAGSFVLWLIFHAGWWTWHGGWSWGPRFLVPMLPFLILPVGSLWRRGWGARAAIVALALAGFLIQLGGVLVDFNDYMLRVNDEDKVLFVPAFLPILGHWRMLWSRATPDLAVLHVPRWAAAIWAAVCGLLVLVGGTLILSWRTTERGG